MLLNIIIIIIFLDYFHLRFQTDSSCNKKEMFPKPISNLCDSLLESLTQSSSVAVRFHSIGF